MVGCAAHLVVTAVMGAAAACGPPREFGDRPTIEQVAANSRAVAVPYGRWTLLRDGDTTVALRIAGRSALGELVAYEWAVLPAAGVGPREVVQ